MNKKIDLTKILKNCPAGTKLYSTIYGEVKFSLINESHGYPIILKTDDGLYSSVTKYGMQAIDYEDKGECTLFPSKDQRDWSKFTAPWYKKEKFDPKILKPFNRVLVRMNTNDKWFCNIFSYINPINGYFMCILADWRCCIPYNDDTKHLVGTKEEAPEYYRYWED